MDTGGIRETTGREAKTATSLITQSRVVAIWAAPPSLSLGKGDLPPHSACQAVRLLIARRGTAHPLVDGVSRAEARRFDPLKEATGYLRGRGASSIDYDLRDSTRTGPGGSRHYAVANGRSPGIYSRYGYVEGCLSSACPCLTNQSGVLAVHRSRWMAILGHATSGSRPGTRPKTLSEITTR
jgi:hypothetical protein